MLPDPVYDLIVESVRVIFIFALPILVAAAVAGGVGGALQGVTNIPEPAINYGLKVLALVVTGYLFLGDGAQAVFRIVRIGLGGE